MKGRSLVACLAIAAIALLSTGLYAAPPGDLTVTQINFVAEVDATLEAPTGQAKLLTDALEVKDARVGKEGKILFVRVENLNGLSIKHASDCAINSQFQFEVPAKLVKAPDGDQGEEPADNPYAKTYEKALVAWTRSRHAAPDDVGYVFSPNRRADVTLNKQQLDAHRTAMANRKKATLVAQRK
jgi:hypothetical protein